jgi:hypothetical protein
MLIMLTPLDTTPAITIRVREIIHEWSRERNVFGEFSRHERAVGVKSKMVCTGKPRSTMPIFNVTEAEGAVHSILVSGIDETPPKRMMERLVAVLS